MEIDKLYLGFLEALKKTKDELGDKAVKITKMNRKEFDLEEEIKDVKGGFSRLPDEYKSLYFDGFDVRIYKRDNSCREHPLEILVFFNYVSGKITINPMFYSKLAQNADIPLTINDRNGTRIRSNYENRSAN